MRPSLSFVALTLLMTMPWSEARGHVMWLHHPGFGLAGSATIGDLDADGVAEAVVMAALAPGVGGALAVIGGDGRNLRMEQLLPVDGVMPFDLVPAPHTDGTRLLTLVQPAPGEHAYSLVEFGGRPLRELRRVAMPQLTRPLAVADIDADGALDVLAITGPYPLDGTQVAVLDNTTFEFRWTDAVDATSAIVAQLDDDPALEIVVTGTPGRVIDGATGLPDWNYPAGFGELLFTGELDAGVPGVEFAALPRDAAFPALTIFRHSPLSPWRDIAVSGYVTRNVTVHDLDCDGHDELVFPTDVHAQTLAVLTPATGALRTLPQEDFRTVLTAAGNLVGDASAELLLTDGDGYYSTVDMLRVIESASGATRFSMQRTFGPYTDVAVADLNGDGSEDVVHAAQRVAYTQPTHTHCMLDGASGQERGCARSDAGWLDAAPVTGQFDATPGEDVVFLGIYGAVAINGATSERLWLQHDIATSHDPFADSATLHFNDDAIDDLVLLGSNAKLRVLDGRNGTILWESVAVGSGVGEPRLVIANVDADPAMELLVSDGADLYAFDAATRLLEWSMDGSVPISRLLAWGEGDACRLGLYAADGAFRTLRCDDRSPAAPPRSLPAGATLVRSLPSDGSHLLVAARGRLSTIDAAGNTRPWSGFLGNALGLDDTATLIARSPRRTDVVIGSDVVVARVRIDLDLVFLDTFD